MSPTVSRWWKPAWPRRSTRATAWRRRRCGPAGQRLPKPGELPAGGPRVRARAAGQPGLRMAGWRSLDPRRCRLGPGRARPAGPGDRELSARTAGLQRDRRSFGEASVLTKFGGGLLWKLGRLEEARECLGQRARPPRARRIPPAAATCRDNLGNVVHEMGRLDQALALLTEALAAHRDVGSRAGEAIDLCDLGGVHRDLARFAESLDYGQRALALSRDIGDQRVEGGAPERAGRLPSAHRLTGPGGAVRRAGPADHPRHRLPVRPGAVRDRLGWALLLSGEPRKAARQAASVLARPASTATGCSRGTR